MENKITFGNSIKKTNELIKKSKGKFWTIILLVLIPVLIINCYSFYVSYNGTVIDYSAVEQINFQEEILEGNLTNVVDAFGNVFSFPDYEQSVTDIIFEILNFLISAFFDAIMIILGTQLSFRKRFKMSDIAGASIRKLLPAIVFGFVGTWVLTEAQSLLFSSTEFVVIFAHLAFKGTLEMLVMLFSAIFSLIIHTFLAILASSMGIMFVSYMTIPTVSGRCRGILIAPQYAKEVLHKNVWKQTFHAMPLIIVTYIIPAFLQIAAVFASKNSVLSIAIIGVSVIIQCVFNGILWMFFVSDFFVLEKMSGIQEKIKDLIEKAMREFENSKNNKQSIFGKKAKDDDGESENNENTQNEETKKDDVSDVKEKNTEDNLKDNDR